jgi:protein arginine kinase activator
MDKCPITGQPCPYKKCIHVTEVSNYQATESKNMCNFCGLPFITEEGGPEFNLAAQQVFQIINSAIKQAAGQDAKIVLHPTPIGCPTCGHTLEEILMTGKIGCGECYKHYNKELLPLIEKCQSGGLKHVGKTPKNPLATAPDLKTLEANLKTAIEKEEYETAERINVEIKKLKGLQS